MGVMLRTPLTDLLSLDVPVVGAPMAGVAGGALAAAVSAAGGLGMIGLGSSEPPDTIRAEGDRARHAGARFGIGLIASALEPPPHLFDSALPPAPAPLSPP